MTVSVTPDRLSELQSRCTSLLSVTHVSRHDLQSLLGVMSFVTSCVRLARVFMSSLLYTLRTYRLSKNCPLSSVNHSDLRWWCHFLPSYNGVSLIKTSPWLDNRLFLSTDACRTGAGGYFTGQYFHTPFPAPILSQFGHDINILELLTIMVALKLSGELLRGQRLICSAIMQIACSPSIPAVLAFLGCTCVYGKSGFSPFVMTSTSLPDT